MPPESWLGRCRSKPLRPTEPSALATRLVRSSAATPRSSSGSSTFWASVFHGNNCACCGTKPTSVLIDVTLRPRWRTAPRVGTRKPAAICNNVLLPQPLGPMTATNLPRLTSKLIPSSTRMEERCPGDGKSCPIPSKASTQSLMPAIPYPNMSIHNRSRQSGQAGTGEEILAVCPRRYHMSAVKGRRGFLHCLSQGAQLCLVQSLRDIRDQIGRVFDADRQPDGGVENAYFLADVSRNAGGGHACRQAGKRLGAPQAHRQLEALRRV